MQEECLITAEGEVGVGRSRECKILFMSEWGQLFGTPNYKSYERRTRFVFNLFFNDQTHINHLYPRRYE